MEFLCTLLRLSPDRLKEVLFWYLKRKGMSPVNEDGYIYAEGDIPILLVAHMDTVFDEPPKFLSYFAENDMLYNPVGGLGGDDRCGVYAILKLLEKYKPHILFTEDEEIGAIGARKAAKNLPKPDVKYMIEFDRSGSNDCVFYTCGNQNFKDYVETFGFKTAIGSFTDIKVLGEAWDIAAVNLSSGYYNEHTENEYVVFSELQKTIDRADRMIRDLKNVLPFDYQTKRYTYSYHTGYNNFNNDYYNFEAELQAYLDDLNDRFDDYSTPTLVFGETKISLPKPEPRPRSKRLSDLIKKLTDDLNNNRKGL